MRKLVSAWINYRDAKGSFDLASARLMRELFRLADNPDLDATSKALLADIKNAFECELDGEAKESGRVEFEAMVEAFQAEMHK